VRFARGGEPTYVSEIIPTLPPLSIPGHAGDLKVGTACIIIDHLLDDTDEIINQLEAAADADERDDNDDDR
jgi:hypothetical protein